MTRRRPYLRAALVATVAALALTQAPVAQSRQAEARPFAPQLVTVDTPTRADKERLQALGLDLTEHAGHDYVEVVLHSPAELAALTAAGFTYDVRIADLLLRQAQVNALDEAYAARVGTSPLPSGRTSYRTLEDYEADLAGLAEKYPRLVKEFTLDRPSLDGRAVHAVEIGSDVTRPATGRPTFVLLGLHHAREWPSGENAMEFAVDLAQGYGRNPRITRLLDRARVVVVPVVNVDGFDLSRTDGEAVDLRALNEYDPLDGSTSILLTPGQAYKRKNCRVVDGQDTPDGTCAASLTSPGGFGVGVDLNRNYAGFWGGPGAAGSEPDPAAVEGGVLDPTYRGAEPFSEPETLNIRDLVASRQVTMLISNHTFGNLILRPNGVAPTTIGHDGKPVGDAPDEIALKRLGARMAAQNGYANQHGWQLYDTTGTTEDWSYNATGGFGYTFEIGPDEFHPPFEDVVDQYRGAGEYAGKGNREAYLIALEHAVDTSMHGVLTGRAPKGAVLRLHKSFVTPTWEGGFEDGVDSSIRVPASGSFRWVVNPSTRPVVASHTYLAGLDEPVSSETFEGTAAPGGSSDHEFRITEGADLWRTTLTWPTPDDLDLEVYRKAADGTLTEVGSSGNLPGSDEVVEVTDAQPGTYVLRVVNYASAAPGYTLTTELFDGRVVRTEGKREQYTLTCSVGGDVRQTMKVFVDRGQVRALDLSACRKRA